MTNLERQSCPLQASEHEMIPDIFAYDYDDPTMIVDTQFKVLSNFEELTSTLGGTISSVSLFVLHTSGEEERGKILKILMSLPVDKIVLLFFCSASEPLSLDPKTLGSNRSVAVNGAKYSQFLGKLCQLKVDGKLSKLISSLNGVNQTPDLSEIKDLVTPVIPEYLTAWYLTTEFGSAETNERASSMLPHAIKEANELAVASENLSKDRAKNILKSYFSFRL